jgi:hypothetical protein
VAPFVGIVKHSRSFARCLKKPRPQFFGVGLPDPENIAEDAGLVALARMSGIEAIVREFTKVDLRSISILQTATRVGTSALIRKTGGNSRPYLLSASSTFCDARPFTGRPFFCSKSAIASCSRSPRPAGRRRSHA